LHPIEQKVCRGVFECQEEEVTGNKGFGFDSERYCLVIVSRMMIRDAAFCTGREYWASKTQVDVQAWGAMEIEFC
jgi:hypothetical protein